MTPQLTSPPFSIENFEVEVVGLNAAPTTLVCDLTWFYGYLHTFRRVLCTGKTTPSSSHCLSAMQWCNEDYSLDLYFWLWRRQAKEIFQIFKLLLWLSRSIIVSWSFKRGGSVKIKTMVATQMSKLNWSSLWLSKFSIYSEIWLILMTQLAEMKRVRRVWLVRLETVLLQILGQQQRITRSKQSQENVWSHMQKDHTKRCTYRHSGGSVTNAGPEFPIRNSSRKLYAQSFKWRGYSLLSKEAWVLKCHVILMLKMIY